MGQRTIINLSAAFASVTIISTIIVDWRTGVMAGILAAVFMLVPSLLEGIVPEKNMLGVRAGLRPMAIAALLVLVYTFPYLITPAFLAPRIQLAELEGNMTGYGYRRVATEGTLGTAEPYPVSIGSDIIVAVEVSDAGRGIKAYYSIGEQERLPSKGSRIRLNGVIEKYGGENFMLVARTLKPVL